MNQKEKTKRELIKLLASVNLRYNTIHRWMNTSHREIRTSTREREDAVRAAPRAVFWSTNEERARKSFYWSKGWDFIGIWGLPSLIRIFPPSWREFLEVSVFSLFQFQICFCFFFKQVHLRSSTVYCLVQALIRFYTIY